MSYVKKLDSLIRAEFPFVDTTIYEIGNEYYLIYINAQDKLFEVIKEYFDKTKTLGESIIISNEIPKKWQSIVNTMKDSEFGSNYSGLGLNIEKLNRLLKLRFPRINHCLIENITLDRIMNVFLSEDGKFFEREMKDFLLDLNLNVNFKFSYNNTLVKEKIVEFDKSNEELLKALKPELKPHFEVNPFLEYVPNYRKGRVFNKERDDEEFWFENISSIYDGSIIKPDLLNINNERHSCLIDYSQLNNFNLRNAILLYDRIFIIIPFDMSIQDFCNNQKVSSSELLSLIETNCISIVSNHPIERYDVKFLNNALNVNPNSIITRRMVSALMIADLVEISNNYLFNIENSPMLLQEAKDLLNDRGEFIDEYITNILTWPLISLRKSFDLLLLNSPVRIGTIGINNVVNKTINEIFGKNCDLEFIINSVPVHTASCLDAVYYPSLKQDHYDASIFSTLMGDMLNLYKNLTEQKLENYCSGYKKSFFKRRLPALSLFDVNEFPSIEDVNEIAKQFGTSNGLQSIHSYLASKPESEMHDIIKQYNSEIKILIDKNRRQNPIIELGLTGALDIAGCFIPGLGMAKLGLERAGKRFLKTKTGETLQKKFSNLDNPENHVKFLHKLSSVAKIKAL